MTNTPNSPCRNILVIEDEETIREAVVEILTEEGYEVYSAEQGKAGLSVLEKIPGPTLVLLDMMMPVMNGWQFIAAQKNRAQFTDISVVVVSAAPEGQALTDDTDLLPVEGLLRKPIDVHKLLKIVDQYCLRRAEAEAETAAMELQPA